MKALRASVGFAAVLALGACAVAPPTGPSVVAMPPQGKSFEQFQVEDFGCRQAATAMIGGPAAQSQAAAQSAVGSAAVGTALGAAAGALIGSASGAAGTGAAIGAGAGLLTGSAVGASNAAYSAGSLQQRYDITYAQCMVARGNTVQQMPYAYAAPYPAYGYRAYYGPGYYYYP
jgi:hypothetical protein